MLFTANSVSVLMKAPPTNVFRDLFRAGRHLRVEFGLSPPRPARDYSRLFWSYPLTKE